MSHRPRCLSALAGAAVTALVLTAGLAPGASAAERATLEGRAIQPYEAAPAGTNTACPATAPAAVGAVPEPQPAGGYSALLKARAGTFWAMPDNGYGGKSNSCDFILRVDRVKVDLLLDGEGDDPGSVRILRSIRLRDPNRRIPFPIYRGSTPERLLTGWDFDPESMRIDRRGDLWFGDEFGPFLLHTDATGTVVEAPIPTPGVRAPENQYGGSAEVNLGSSSGFESMAISKDRRYLYPALERALSTDEDKTKRLIFEYDLRRGAYTGRRLVYGADSAIATTPPGQDQHVIADLTAVDDDRYVVIERDFRQGAAARFEKVFVVDFTRVDAAGVLRKREVVDLLDIADPQGISLVGAREGDLGLGDPFRFPYVTTESVLPVGDDGLVLVNDNNFGSVGGRNPLLPDYTDFIELSVPELDED